MSERGLLPEKGLAEVGLREDVVGRGRLLHEPAGRSRVPGGEGDAGVVEGIAADLRMLSHRSLARRARTRNVDVLHRDPGKAGLAIQRMDGQPVAVMHAPLRTAFCSIQSSNATAIEVSYGNLLANMASAILFPVSENPHRRQSTNCR